MQALRGQRLKAVRYYELEGQMDTWCTWPGFDTLSHGLDLLLESGQAYLVTWGQTFFQYDLDVRPGALVDELRAATFTNVSHESRWTPLVGQVITDVTVFWEDMTEVGPQFHRCVQDLRLTFESGQVVYLSTSDYREQQGWSGIADNIVVFFDQQSFEQRRLGT